MVSFFAFVMALVSVGAFFAGFEGFSIVPMAITGVLAIFGLIFPAAEKPVSSRVACLLAAVLAATPLLVPVVRDFRIGMLEKQRQAETRPLYDRLEENVEETKPKIEAYYKRYGFFPNVNEDGVMRGVNRQGRLEMPPAMEGLVAPEDPFSSAGAPMRWVAVRGEGVMLVSRGQDGVEEMPLPGVMMDPPPADPMGSFALLGRDPRLNTYDPTNGALGLGDVVRYHGKKPYEETFGRLFDSWDQAHKASPYEPTETKRTTAPDPDPQSARDAKAAFRLVQQGDFLAALALASRSIQERHQYPAQWTDEDYQAGFVKGLALYHLGMFREASDALIEYTALSPNDPAGHFYLAAALYRAGRSQDTRLHLAAASQIAPQDPIADRAHAALQAIERGSEPSFPAPAALPAAGEEPPSLSGE